MSIESYLRAAPKAELHVHLEGAIRPATLLTLAERNGVALPADNVEDLRRWFTYRDFPHFAEIYVTITRCLKTADDYELIAYEYGAELARQNARYAEVTFTPATHALRFGVTHNTDFGQLRRPAAVQHDAERRSGAAAQAVQPGRGLHRRHSAQRRAAQLPAAPS